MSETNHEYLKLFEYEPTNVALISIKWLTALAKNDGNKASYEAVLPVECLHNIELDVLEDICRSEGIRITVGGYTELQAKNNNVYSLPKTESIVTFSGIKKCEELEETVIETDSQISVEQPLSITKCIIDAISDSLSCVIEINGSPALQADNAYDEIANDSIVEVSERRPILSNGQNETDSKGTEQIIIRGEIPKLTYSQFIRQYCEEKIKN